MGHCPNCNILTRNSVTQLHGDKVEPALVELKFIQRTGRSIHKPGKDRMIQSWMFFDTDSILHLTIMCIFYILNPVTFPFRYK